MTPEEYAAKIDRDRDLIDYQAGDEGEYAAAVWRDRLRAAIAAAVREAVLAEREACVAALEGYSRGPRAEWCPADAIAAVRDRPPV